MNTEELQHPSTNSTEPEGTQQNTTGSEKSGNDKTPDGDFWDMIDIWSLEFAFLEILE
jgi:hypothetical protein